MQATLKLPPLYARQREAIYDPARYVIIEASTKVGKTAGCIVWLLELAWQFGAPGRNYWWVAPVSDQASIAFKRMRRGLPLPPGSLVNKTIDLPNGAVIWFKSADKPDSLYGEDVYAAVIDEGTRVKEDSWYAVRSTLTKTRGSVRIIGNVKGRKNWVYRLARRAESGEPDMAHYRITAWDAVDAGILDRAEVEDAQRTLPAHVFRELYLAEPAEDGGNPFGLPAIAACVRPMSTQPVTHWGIDLAKSHDWTVAVGLDAYGLVAMFERWQGPWEATIRRIGALIGNAPALIDSTGVGDPIVEQLHRTRAGVEGFKFTAQSKQQLMEGLASAISQREIGFPDGTIRSELDEFEYTYSAAGVRYSAADGLHDDCVCALALAWRCRTARPRIEYGGAYRRAIA